MESRKKNTERKPASNISTLEIPQETTNGLFRRRVDLKT